MFKNTINKVFQKKFPNNIWKIEIDIFHNYLAIEVRDKQTTLPQYTVFDFSGQLISSSSYIPLEKEWMMEGIQKGFIILKKVGENTPVKEGIRVIHSNSGQEVFTNYEYQLLDVYEDYIKVRHRSVVSGNELYLRIEDGTLHSNRDIDITHLPRNGVIFPIVYNKTPHFFSAEKITDYLWLSKAGEHYIWCYHQHESDSYCLVLAVSDLNQVLYREVIIDRLERMIPQPYFQVGRNLFFLSQNKQEIVSYLV